MISISTAISIGTFVVAVITLIYTLINNKKTRRITVLLAERQKKQDEVFKHITYVLDLGRKSYDVDDELEKQKIKYELLNSKVLIWVYLNKENKYAKEMRSNCNLYIFQCASSLEEKNAEERKRALLSANKYAQEIWVLIDKYIEEEDKLKNKFI
ncbi:putative holin-like toxin [Bacillus weihaiensis]|uniref:putative holin-like toxin n=1 Tax=Bacillus weihaiensis TaxID=1547283 RepID=UPI002352D24A|nr:putative holin-like toxin [Bacillus weihaiensis]